MPRGKRRVSDRRVHLDLEPRRIQRRDYLHQHAHAAARVLSFRLFRAFTVRTQAIGRDFYKPDQARYLCTT